MAESGIVQSTNITHRSVNLTTVNWTTTALGVARKDNIFIDGLVHNIFMFFDDAEGVFDLKILDDNEMDLLNGDGENTPKGNRIIVLANPILVSGTFSFDILNAGVEKTGFARIAWR